MDGQDEIRPIARPQFGGGHGTPGPAAPRPADAPADRGGRRRLDEVVLTEPRLAALRLLRERVLDRTRGALELGRHGEPAIAFVASPSQRADVFVGRLLSDQNLLAARRRGAWPEPRIAAALESGMTDGLAETLEVLHEVDELDVEVWELLCAVLREFHRKVCSAQQSGS